MLKLLRSFSLLGGVKSVTGNTLKALLTELTSNLGMEWVGKYDSIRIDAGTGQALTANVASKILINGLGSASDVTQIKGLPNTIWDGTNSKLMPEKVKDIYSLKIVFTLNPTGTATSNHVTLDLKVNGTIIESTSMIIPKSTAHIYTWVIPVTASTASLINGIEIHATADMACTLWGASIFIQRLSKGV
jgi:hypothetical protein